MANNIILPFSELQAELNDEAMIDPNAIIEITENGRYNVARYGYADVNVEGGGGETWETVFEGSVTTEAGQHGNMATLDYSEIIDADTIKVTFGGVEYECERIDLGNTEYAYGGVGEQGFDFSQYPFVIMSSSDSVEVANAIFTETAGTYTLKIEEPQSGGNSDLSTAEVTVINSSAEGYNINTAFVDTEEESILTGHFINSGDTKVLNVVQYKGSNMTSILDATEYGDPVPENNVSMSGDVSYDGTYFKVTGDCTITILTK